MGGVPTVLWPVCGTWFVCHVESCLLKVAVKVYVKKELSGCFDEVWLMAQQV